MMSPTAFCKVRTELNKNITCHYYTVIMLEPKGNGFLESQFKISDTFYFEIKNSQNETDLLKACGPPVFYQNNVYLACNLCLW